MLRSTLQAFWFVVMPLLLLWIGWYWLDAFIQWWMQQPFGDWVIGWALRITLFIKFFAFSLGVVAKYLCRQAGVAITLVPEESPP